MGKSKHKKNKNKQKKSKDKKKNKNEKQNKEKKNFDENNDNLNNIDEKGNNEEFINENANKEESIDNISQISNSNVNNYNNSNNVEKNEEENYKQIEIVNDENVLNNAGINEEGSNKQNGDVVMNEEKNNKQNGDVDINEEGNNKQIENDNANKDLDIHYDEEQQAIISLRNKYLNLDSENENNNFPTTLYCIISNSEKVEIKKEKIEIFTTDDYKIETQNEELIEVYVNNKNKLKFHEYNNSFQQKNIYLYKTELKNINDYENIKIKLTMEGGHLISKEKFNIQKNQQLFIYSISFEYEKFFDKIHFWNNKVRGFIENAYNLSYIQKFLIFLDIVKLSKNEHLLDCLLIESLFDIYNKEKIIFEFYLIFINVIINDTKKFDELSENFKEIMYLLILNLSNKKEITFKKYNNPVYSETIKRLEEFNINFNNNKFNLWLNLFFLIYHQYSNPERFNEFFNKIELKQEAVEFIKNHKKLFPNLQFSDMKLIYDHANRNVFSLDDILALTSNFNEYIKLFCYFGDTILKENISINFSRCPQPKDVVDINLFIVYIDFLMRMPIDKKNIKVLIEQYTNVLDKFNKKDFKSLMILKQYTQNYDAEHTLNEILNKVIHSTGKYFIERDQFNNLDIIRFIQEDALVYYKDYEKEKDYAALIGHIDLDQADEEFEKFCQAFNYGTYNYYQLLKYNYNIFLNAIFEKAKTFEHLEKLYKMFRLYRQYPGRYVIDKFIGLLQSRKLEKQDLSISDLCWRMAPLYRSVSNDNNYNLDKLMKATKSNFSHEEIDKVFISILNCFIEDDLNEICVNELIKNLKNISNDDIVTNLKNFEKDSMKAFFLDKLKNNKLVTEDVIFNKNLSDNTKLLFELIKMNYFEENKFKNVVYIQKTKEYLDVIIDTLENYEFSMEQLMIMNELNKMNDPRVDDSLIKRLYIVCLGNQTLADELYQKITTKIDQCLEVCEKIKEIIQIFAKYYPNEKKSITAYYRKKEKDISESQIYLFPEISELKEFEKSYEEAHEITNLKDSKLFIEIFEQIENSNINSNDENINNDLAILNETKEKFFNLKNLFTEETEDKVGFAFLEEIITKIDKNNVEEEVNILKNLFNIDEESTNNISDKLKYLNTRKQDIIKIGNTILLLRDFHLNNSTIFVSLKKYYKYLNQCTSLKKINAVNILINKLDIDLLDSDKHAYAQGVIENMYKKQELMNFILTKNINDIHQMGEFIDDSEDVYITLSDIDQLESCMTFIQELNRAKTEQNAKEFLNQFLNLLDDKNFKDIGVKFQNSSDKYQDFHELYTNHLNPNEMNKEHIKMIYEESIFVLKSNYPQYQCIACYNNNGKYLIRDFDEILDLRDVALLRKKDQKNEDYIKICEVFATIISDIQEILKLLNVIASKGYFEEINYAIKIDKGEAYKFQINSTKEINYLKKIIAKLKISNNDNQSNTPEDTQNKNVIFVYLTYLYINYVERSKYIKDNNNGDGNEKMNLDNIITELNKIKENQDETVKSVYSENTITRMMYGRQFNYLYKSITDISFQRNEFSESILNNILKYLTNNKINNYQKPCHYFIKNIDTSSIANEPPLELMFIKVKAFLNMLFRNNYIYLEDIYKNANLLNPKKRGIYSHSCNLESIETDTVYCSLSLTGHFPISQTVLYCNSTTSEEEITSFIYRSVKCVYPVLFILIKPENLNIEKKNLLIELLKDLYSQDPKQMLSCLLFIYSKENKTKEIITEIEKLPNHQHYEIPMDNNKNYRKFPNIEIYTSEYSGLGKSTLIRRTFENEREFVDYKYEYFPLGGNIKRNEIIERLLNLSNKKIALHLDLYSSSQIELIREFLFSFLILRYYSQNENIFYYGPEIKIKVEIPNGFVDYKKLFPIFDFFKTIRITHQNLPPLIVPESVLSNVQIVCNYLKNLDYINNRDVFINGISYNESVQSIIAIPLSQNECQQLIFRNLNIDNPNYYQITSYINIVAEQLILFTNSYYLNYYDYLRELRQIKGGLNNVRYFFVNSLTKVTKHFITSSYDDIIKSQMVTNEQQKGEIELEEANRRANEILTKKIPFSIREIRPSLILINEDGHSISEIVTCENNTDEYRLLKAIYSADLLSNEREVLDYRNLENRDFLIEVKKVLDLHNATDEYSNDGVKELNGKPLKYIKDIVESYVFTADNFMKLILISLRLRTNIPVILMGETGCGKTSLIRIIAELKNNTMYTLNIHAGIEDNDIIQFLEDKNLFMEESRNKKKKDNNNSNISNSNIWVFLDEINTCNSLGLISEIMLKHSCNGHSLKNQVKFIAACNPYRLDTGTEKKEIIGLYNEKFHSVRKLVYSVNPLPVSLLNFVFDFGTPEPEDIKRYITNMVSQILNKLIIDKNILNRIQRIAEVAIFDAQEFIKANYEISSVSLREIRRWGILFEWFLHLLSTNRFIFKEIKLTNEYDICYYSLNLSIYLCYYIRIFNKNIRKRFTELMKQSFGKKFNFEHFPKRIQNIIATEVDLEEGIAKNKALLENLFAIFVCLNTKIPLFIIGKPGCSKSLSAQLIFKSMNGKDSSSEFFKEFPKVYTKSYQGSLTSNSKGVLKIFKKARDSLKNEEFAKNIISAIYFDEMGLAEISKNNPLKVIHSQLEYDENKEKVSFIGISNWPLDASKMNRGIHLSIPEPDEDDLKETAIAIAESYDKRLTHDYKEYFEKLALTYYEYIEKLRNDSYDFEFRKRNQKEMVKDIKDFHGTRDFYHLIKIASKLFIESNFTKDNNEIENILCISIERNFGGLDKSIKIFKEIFKKYVTNINDINEYNVMKCIENNILDSKSRYLLIESKSSISQFLITSILEKLGKNHMFYYGSNFEDDTSHGYYSAKILNKIQVTMSHDNVMILKNLTSMYPSLYDLFNQNFRKVGDSNYARIALGNSNTQNYFVNDSFRCIILLDRAEIDKQDPPFINRFEKHILSFEYLLNENQIIISKYLNKIFTDLVKSDSNINIDLKSELLNCDLEEIQGIIYKLSQTEEMIFENDNDHEEYLKENILEKFISIFSQDLIFYGKHSDFSQKYKEKFDRILEIYLKNENLHKNLRVYLENIESNKHIVYTFSNILDSIFDINNEFIENDTFGPFMKATTKNIFIGQYNSERAIDELIMDYYSNALFNLCVLHFDTDDFIHLSHINYLIGNIENTLKENNDEFKPKVILFIIHIKRNDNKKDIVTIQNEYLISHLTEWKQIFIDNLNGLDISFTDIFNASIIDLFHNKQLIDLEKEFDKCLYNAFGSITFNFKINFSNIKKEEYIIKMCEFINKNEVLKHAIQNSTIKKIMNLKTDIIMDIFTKYNFEEDDVDFISVIIKYMKSIHRDALITTLVQFEEKNIISTKLLSEIKIENTFVDDIYNECISKFSDTITKYTAFNRARIDLFLGISYPLIIPIFKSLNNYTNTLINSYMENEYKLRQELIEMEDYIKEKVNLENNLKIEFEREYFTNIINDNNDNPIEKELINLFIKDYIMYYLSKSNEPFTNQNILHFFNTLFKLFISRDSENKNLTFENITKFILFLETYKNYIHPLCIFLCSIDSSVNNNFIKDYVEKLSLEEFLIANKGLIYVNNIFFNLYESVVSCIFNIAQDINNISNKIFDTILNSIEIFSNLLMKFNIELRLSLKQILYLKDFIHVKKAFARSKLPLKDNLKTYLDLLKKENEIYLMPNLNNNNNENTNKENSKKPLYKEFKFLEDKLKNQEFYPDLIVKLLNNKIRISKDEDYRINLLEILCSNDLFIIKSKIIFETILNKFNIMPINKTLEEIENGNDSDDENKNDSNDKDDNNELDDENDNNINDDYDDSSSNQSNSDDDNNVSSDDDNSNSDEEDSDNSDTDTDSDSDTDTDSDSDTDTDSNSSDEDEEEDDEDGLLFLSELKNEQNSKLIKFINRVNNECLDEILLSLFDRKISNYFQLKRSKINLISNQSFDIFEKCVKYIESERCKFSKNNKLGILYCISYIKYYCIHLSNIIYENDELLPSYIYGFLNEGSNTFRKVIKIYLLKILNLLIIKDYGNFIEFINKKNLFINDFNFKEKVPCPLDCLFIQNESFKEYKDLRKNYKICEMENFNSTNEFTDNIETEESLMVFYDLLINEVISNLKKNYDRDYYLGLSNIVNDILNKLQLSPHTEKLFSIYTKINSIEKQLPEIQNMNIKTYEMLLYAHKFALICSTANPSSIYSNIISPKVIDNLKNVYIPGGEPNDSLLIESGHEIEEFVKNGKKGAIYMCSCYNWYTVGECGLPTQTFACKVCGEMLGGHNHVLVRRDGHVRIYIDINESRQGVNRDFGNANVHSKLLSTLLREVQEMEKMVIKGFRKVRKSFFINKNKKVREMNSITYRILSFIFYSCIYYNGKMGYLNSNQLKNYYYSDIKEEQQQSIANILNILTDIWVLIVEELHKKKIDNIQCFLNMVIPKLSQFIKNYDKSMIDPNERNEFELLCNQIIDESIEQYKNYFKTYIKNNKEILKIDDDTIKSILQETSNLSNLSTKAYPLIQYFNVVQYPTTTEFTEQFNLISDRVNKFPVITTYLNTLEDKESIEFLENFQFINPFVNYMLEKYNNKISREEAKKIKIKDELKNDKSMKKLFKNFIIGWNNVYNNLSNFDCHGRLKPKELTKEDVLAYYLNDKIEKKDYGKYIATVYKVFITCQNEFLKSFLENNRKGINEYLNLYSDQIQDEIIVQKANYNTEIVNLKVENDLYDSFDDLIFAFSNRKCFEEKTGKINYVNYKENLFDFNAIEIELSKILLPGKRLFKNEQDQDFITYAFEQFAQKENIISDFKGKIKKLTSLSHDQKSNILHLIKKIDYNLILRNIQNLFLYFVNNKNITGEELLIGEIYQLPKIISISMDDEFRYVIRKIENELYLNQLIDLYEYIEFLNYDKILNNINPDIRIKLNDKQVEKLNEHFNDNSRDLLVSKKYLGEAVRKFISRFLVSNQYQVEKFNQNLIGIIRYKEELWNDKLTDPKYETEFENELNDLEMLNINIEHSVDLYEKLGGERLDYSSKKSTSSKGKSSKKKDKCKSKATKSYKAIKSDY